MSSPASRRSQRNSRTSTPRRNARGSQIPSSSPLAAGADDQLLSEASQQRGSQGTPRGAPPQNNVANSSPIFFQSSVNSSGAANGVTGSSPVPHMSDAPDGDRTPRASGLVMGDSSPIRYASSSSPTRAAQNQRSDNVRSSSGAPFAGSSQPDALGSSARNRRGDVQSDALSASGPRRRIFVNEQGVPVGGRESHSDTATFSNLDPNTSDAAALGGGSTRIVWGTNVSIGDSMAAMKDFLLNFRKKYRMVIEGELVDSQQLPPHHPAHERVYMDMLKGMLELGLTSLNLDVKNLKAYPPTKKLWYQLAAFPNEIIPVMDVAIKDVMAEIAEKRMAELRQQQQHQRPRTSTSRVRDSSSLPPVPSSDIDVPGGAMLADIPDLEEEVHNRSYRVRPFGMDNTINLRELNPGDMDKMVSVKGLVIRTTPIIPDMKEAFFRCSACGHTVKVDIDRGKIAEPTTCPRQVCASPNSMQIVHNRCGFSDKQVVKLQETPDNVPDGQTPHSVSICVYDDLVDVCKAGDRIEITGIFKCTQVRVNPRQRSVKNIFKTYVDALHIAKTDKRRLGIDISTIEEEISDEVAGNVEETRKISEEEEAKIKATAARPDVYELLARSLGPSIYEMDDVKKGILLQLFGGTNKSFEKGGSPKYRGDINVLLCGDPSTAKSQLLQYVHKIAPRGVYTSGKGSSAVGLTAYITRDPETRQLVLESGALVLSDGGVCCIDEFDKMSDSTRSVLHEVMEQQTVSIAKAGIITTLNARTSILASANPIGSKYNPNLPVPQNIDLPPTLLSRFDLVYLVLDRIDEQNDRRLARHLVSMYLDDKPDSANIHEVLPVEFLTAYISYARSNVQPTLTAAAGDALVSAYVAMRGLGDDLRTADRRITATTRQLESMIRLAEAHAKMRLAPTVELRDVEEAVRLIKSAIKQSATDQRTGLIDMSLLTEGTSAGERRRRRDLKEAVKGVVEEAGPVGTSVRVSEVARSLGERSGQPVEANEVTEVLKALEAEGWCALSGDGARRTVRRILGVGG